MKKMEIMNSLSRTFNKAGFQLKKHSPELLVAAGIVGTVVSAVMACKATTKINGILDKAKEEIESVHNCLEDEKMSEEYTPEDGKKDLALIYAQTGVKLVKLYAPAAALGVLSIGSILASNNILRKRNAALAAAYAVVDKRFKEYRSRVIDRFGKEIDHELKYNIKAKTVEKTVVDENGKEQKVNLCVLTILWKTTGLHLCTFPVYGQQDGFSGEESFYNLYLITMKVRTKNMIKTILSKKYEVINEGDTHPTYTRDSWEIPIEGTEIWCTGWKRGQTIKPYGDGRHVIVGIDIYHVGHLMNILDKWVTEGETWGIEDVEMIREQQINRKWKRVEI